MPQDATERHPMNQNILINHGTGLLWKILIETSSVVYFGTILVFYNEDIWIDIVRMTVLLLN